MLTLFTKNWARRLVLPLLLVLTLAGCSRQELHGKVSESQANEMVALLQGEGIDARKEPRAEGSYAITIQQEDFSRAVEMLKANGLPRGDFADLGTVYGQDNMIKSPVEEHARMVYLKSQQLASTLQTIDGVVVARVHLAVPEKDPLSDKPKPASASVFIKHRAGRDLSGQVNQMKALIVNGVEGLPYENVTVALFPAEAAPLPRPAPTASASLNLPLAIVAAVGVLALICGGLMFWLRRRSTPPTGSGLVLVKGQDAKRA